jgi:hypothetical protein
MAGHIGFELRCAERKFISCLAHVVSGAPSLVSRGIVYESGIPGPNFYQSLQYQANSPYTSYFIDTRLMHGKTPYQQAPGTPTFPQPNTAYAILKSPS